MAVGLAGLGLRSRLRDMSHKVFLSYSHRDERKAKRLEGLLEERGVDCWRDKTSLRAGQQFPAKITKAIRNADGLVFLVSRHSLESSWVAERELALADGFGKRIIPVFLEDVETNELPDAAAPFLLGMHAVMTSDYSSLRELADLIVEALPEPTVPEPTPPIKTEKRGKRPAVLAASALSVAVVGLFVAAWAVWPLVLGRQAVHEVGRLSLELATVGGDGGVGDPLTAHTDAAVEDNGEASLELTRYYNLHSAVEADFGTGWHLMVPYHLEPEGTARQQILNVTAPVQLALVDRLRSARRVFELGEDADGNVGYFPTRPGAADGLYIMSNGGYRLEDRSGRSLHFDGAGQLVIVILGPAARLVYHYEGRRVVAIETLPDRVVPLGRTAAVAAEVPARLRLEDRLDPQEFEFEGEESDGYTYAAPTRGRWVRIVAYPGRSFVLSDTWGNRYFFDESGRFVGLMDAGPPEAGAQISGIMLQRDDEGRVVEARMGGVGKVFYEYDAGGQLARAVSAEEGTFGYAYSGGEVVLQGGQGMSGARIGVLLIALACSAGGFWSFRRVRLGKGTP